MSDGILLIEKHAGPTSHDVVAAVRRALGMKRVGHAGTLDPFATGLLVVLVGRATRLARFIQMLPKTYRGVVRFGTATSTDDATGQVTASADVPVGPGFRLEVEAAMKRLAARGEQLPPAVSAKQVDGERAYRIARRGDKPALKPAAVAIHRLDGHWTSATDLAISVECSSGTYIRAIARDLGAEVGVPAHLAELQRETVGPWSWHGAHRLTPSHKDEYLPPYTEPEALHPMHEAVAHLPRVELGAEDAERFIHGIKLPDPGAHSGPVAVFGPAAQGLLGVAEPRQGRLEPEVVLAG